ncbi:MAG: hypothetical protein ACE145_08230 [Terriglobia bacterium]
MTKVANSVARRRPWAALLIAVLVTAAAAGKAAAAPPDPTLEAGFRAMYGLDFRAAAKFFGDFQQAHPQDPMGYAADSTRLVFSELHRLKLLEAQFEPTNRGFFASPSGAPDPEIKRQILELTSRADGLSEARLRANPADEHALFALALTNGILGDYFAAVEHRYWGSVKYGRQGDEYARKLLERNPEFYDAYLWTGVTNYIYGSLSLPVRWTARLFGLRGDKSTGVANLQLAAEKGQYLRPYAKVLLAVAYLREKNRPAAAALLAQLSSEFPGNDLFAAQARRLQANGS